MQGSIQLVQQVQVALVAAPDKEAGAGFLGRDRHQRRLVGGELACLGIEPPGREMVATQAGRQDMEVGGIRMDGMRVGHGGDELLHRPHHTVLANAVDRDLVAGVYAAAYKALATPVYSSAVFNFIPKTAMEFYQAVASDDTATQHRLLKSFFMPYLAIRNREEDYGVSIIKAGARIVGHDGGPVRAPLVDLKPSEMEELKALIDKLGPQ